MKGWVYNVGRKQKKIFAKLLYCRLLCLSLHANRAYKGIIISTIVDILLGFSCFSAYKGIIISTPSMRILTPNEICTDSYVIGGVCDSISQAENFYNYLRTSFVRFLILQSLSSINLSREAYVLVPLQDFSHPWTDKMLYKKYGLTDEEIAFIESMIRPME